MIQAGQSIHECRLKDSLQYIKNIIKFREVSIFLIDVLSEKDELRVCKILQRVCFIYGLSLKYILRIKISLIYTWMYMEFFECFANWP